MVDAILLVMHWGGVGDIASLIGGTGSIDHPDV